jgi:hypothetical protein
VLTSEANLSSLLREIKSVVNREFFFRNTATGNGITARSVLDYTAVQKFLDEKKLHYFTFYTKASKPVKTIIRYLPCNISAEDITVAFQEIDYECISVKQVTAKRPIPEEGITNTSIPPPLSWLL